jgi:uncharacterized protein YbjT (DUF2867 family)
MTLVVGATGILGTEICRQLIARGHKVRAMVRKSSDPMKVSALLSMGAHVIEGDLRDPASLRRACTDVRCVITTAAAIGSYAPDNSFLNVDLAVKDLIDTAKAARVDQFIYTSFSGGLNPDCDLTTAKRGVEQHLLESGLSYTILRPSCFMEVWLSPPLGFDAIHGRAQLIGTGEQRVSYISLFDVAQFAVAAVGNRLAANTILELGGPAAVSPLEVIGIFEEMTGRKFEVSYIPVDALRAQYAAADNPLARTYAALMLESARGDVIPMQDVQRLFPKVTLRSVRDYAHQIVGVTAAV